MGAGYIATVTAMYGLLLLAASIARLWLLPPEWERPIIAAILLYVIVIVQTAPAAPLARRAKDPWIFWTFLNAVCAHALGAMAAATLWPVTELRFAPATPMDFERIWDDAGYPFAASFWIVLYALASGTWAVLVGWAARSRWGATPPEQHLVRIRKHPTPSA